VDRGYDERYTVPLRIPSSNTQTAKRYRLIAGVSSAGLRERERERMAFLLCRIPNHFSFFSTAP